ncbi:hypothetical protein IVB36_04035 [Bradyrhizobium sp. 35]|uniref:hypothetical protein n=1 Tax=Bradyrhizobium sp. 35 TaxID=2782670 RepID=UPI001FFC1EC5|nr:hypothetical protein [Bradyrhizobium sp. 35]MCK1450097.1 hypothetical protein [Bradyrhizobium sp. 35]
MPERIRFTTEVDGHQRNLFSVTERANGDLMIFFGYAGRYGYEPTNSEILTQKYSVHVSPNSHEYCTLKHTLWLTDGTKLTSSALTDAPKKGGFSFIFSRRPPNLANEKYLIPENNTDQRVQLTCPVELNLSLVYSVVVAAADAQFGPQPGLSVIEFRFAKFKLVILYQHIVLPPHHRGDLLHTLTAPPELGADRAIQDTLRNLMKGKDQSTILKQFQDHSHLLANSLAHHLLEEVSDQTLRRHLTNFIRQTENALTDVERYVIVGVNQQDRAPPMRPNDPPR